MDTFEITHVCGHIQVISASKKKQRLYMDRFGQDYFQRQNEWLKNYPCPDCYSIIDAKRKHIAERSSEAVAKIDKE